MESTRTKIGLYAIVGFTAVIVVLAGLFMAGVQLPFLGAYAKTGTLTVSIMDAPADLTHLNVTLSALYVHSESDDSWIKLNFTEGVSSVYFDLLALRNVTKDLSTSKLPVGNYSKMRLDVEFANATLFDGSTEDLTVPPGYIDVVVLFEINADQTTSVIVDMQVDTVAISQSGNLKPVLKAAVEYLY